MLNLAGREGRQLQTGFLLPEGRELPLVVRRDEQGGRAERASSLNTLRVTTPSGVLPVAALASVRRVPAPPVIVHHNGRREMSVYYNLDRDAPATGPGRLALEEKIKGAVREAHRPRGYTVEAADADDSTDWFKRILLPVLLLLYLVLAVVFESLTMPVLVLLALPLTLLGATWALVLAGMPLDMMALLGGLALFGLTINPAILLVDRMQQHVLGGGWSAGAAALAAVRERTRPVLMTTATTVAALWPLALVTGQENEIWPPFATIVIGGLVTSTLLTLLVIPVGFVLLQRLDRLFGRVGPWVVTGWLLLTTAIMVPLIRSEQITSLTWQIITTVLVAGVLLGLAGLVVWRPHLPEPASADGPPAVDVRSLRKVYGRPGPVGRAWRAPEEFARKVLERGGQAFHPGMARERMLPRVLLALGGGYLAFTVQSLFWQLFFLMVTAVLIALLLLDLRRARGKADAVGRVLPGGPEGWLAATMPWVALLAFAWDNTVAPRLAGEGQNAGPLALAVIAVIVGVVQFGRRTARRVATGELSERPGDVALSPVRGLWRQWARRLFGLDLPREEVLALAAVSFKAERGMIGVLGPNGAGKTTLLRQLAGVLEPTRGRITIGGVPMELLRRHLARWVGYLPQDSGLPKGLTAREYLGYWAALYQLPVEVRAERVSALLEEVGLGERADEKIGGYSGGMRQRVAVARTLLRLPPVIIVDEPTVGLDPRERIRFRNLLARLARERVVLFSTHVVEDVAVACERAIVLGGGRVVFDGSPDDLAGRADGQVWELELGASEDAGELDARIVDQLPTESGGSLVRMMAPEAPHERARPAEPTLEDGYLFLVGERGRE